MGLKGQIPGKKCVKNYCNNCGASLSNRFRSDKSLNSKLVSLMGNSKINFFWSPFLKPSTFLSDYMNYHSHPNASFQ